VAGGLITSVTMVSNGCYFAVGDLLTASIPSGINFTIQVTAITNATGATWVGDNFDSALLYGSLCEAGVYLKSGQEDGMYATYQDRYVQAIALLKNLGDGKQRIDAYRDGQVRLPVV
jgi:hypothetical protein